jgi:hypothetical protein
VIYFGFAAYLLRPCPPLVIAAAMVALMSMPLTWETITEYAPEIVCSLFTAIAAVLMLRLPLFGAPWRARVAAGLCFGLAFMAHPSAFAFTSFALAAAAGLPFLVDVILARQWRLFVLGLQNGLVNVLLSVWLPALYMIPRRHEYWSYFYTSLISSGTRWVWLTPMSLGSHLAFYTFGPGGMFMFGNRQVVYAAIIGLGIAAAWWRGDRALLTRQLELLVLAFLFWLLPTLEEIKVVFFASASGFLIGFMMVIALRAIYQAIPNGSLGVAVACGLATVALATASPHLIEIANTPQSLLEREFDFHAIDEIENTLLQNATDYHGVIVYMTNIGAYAPNILQYYLLKQDPVLDWTINSDWITADPVDHVKVIQQSKPDFVVASERDNGLTYSQIAQPAEDAVTEAMWNDSDYMALNRFYGPFGRTVTLFGRRVAFAGWRPIYGITTNLPGRRDDGRYSEGRVSYLQTYAEHSQPAELLIDCSGEAGGTIAIFVNQQHIADIAIPIDNQVETFDKTVNLLAGKNDIVMEYSDIKSRVTYHRLLVIPQLAFTR